MALERDTVLVRADMINDLKRLDEELSKHLSRVWMMKHNVHNINNGVETKVRIRVREDWEIDVSKLVVKEKIGSGTFGSVHRGFYDGKDVAVKVLDLGEDDQMKNSKTASRRSAFKQEVSVWHKLDHPNIAKMVGATRNSQELDNCENLVPNKNASCILVEYLPGRTLKNYLVKSRRKKLAFNTVMQLALDIARGLSYLHSKKIVHMDVKTENMLLDKDRTVKLTDFGVARVEASNASDMTGQTGTLGYMAPEVISGEPYDHKCDVYSFGICLWETYCCDMPYPDLNFSELTSAVVYKNLRPEIPRCCPRELANVMKKCWDRDPKKRPEMRDVVGMLEAIHVSKGRGMVPLDRQSRGFFCCFRP
ncbi:Serine/threonine-protein kinase [Actinidia chinensis var. chinensis]|uniref:Serine/threonine-protein kinase n=1 Tax=Actinidia chinensis var. chinensis TaxID=1590841 RepID=A0A2R6RE88_ACTCC|nr:Serine/threonine-protein kinase [Actinidia chinensis var. chinensis]